MGLGCNICAHEKDITLLIDRVHDMGRDTKSLIKWLKGNGTPGLITKIALTEQSLEKIHTRHDVLEESVERIAERAGVCEGNDKQIARIWRVMMWAGGIQGSFVAALVLKLAFGE